MCDQRLEMRLERRIEGVEVFGQVVLCSSVISIGQVTSLQTQVGPCACGYRR
jgi:hypothetical protein